jgi:hypothetical protein
MGTNRNPTPASAVRDALGAANAPPPLCKHGVPAKWQADRRYAGGGTWVCSRTSKAHGAAVGGAG